MFIFKLSVIEIILILYYIKAPFYPKEAEKKGATASEYGLVFGVFELVVFIVSPIIGKVIYIEVENVIYIEVA